jgi:hypothetical protein
MLAIRMAAGRNPRRPFALRPELSRTPEWESPEDREEFAHARRRTLLFVTGAAAAWLFAAAFFEISGM